MCTETDTDEEKVALRQRVAALEADARRSRAILATVPEIVMEVDAGKIYAWANQPGLDFFGSDVVGREAACYFEGEQDTYDRVRPLFHGDEQTFYVESWQRRRDGEKRLLAWWCRVLKDAAGNVIGALSTARDVTDERAAQKALAESEAKFRTLFKNAQTGMYRTKLDGSAFLDVNKKFAEIIGFSPAELVGAPVRIRWADAADRDKMLQSLKAQGGTLTDYEARVVAKNGEVKDVLACIILHPDQGYLDGSMVDITERKKKEQALRESEALNRALVASIPLNLFLKDLDCNYLSVNKRHATSLGLSAAAFVGKNDYDFFPREVAAAFQADDRAVMQSGEVKDIEERYVAGDQYRWAHTVKAPVRDDAGTVIALLGFFEDITDRKRTEMALRESEERNRATLRCIGDGVISTDATGRITQMNPVAEQLTGWPEAEARDKPVHEVFCIVNEQTRAAVESPVDRVLREGVVVGLANHTVLSARDGTDRPIADSGAPIRDDKGETTGVVLVFRDQTEERAEQKALEESERKFHDTVKHLDEGYYCCTLDGLLQEHNVAFNRILGFDDERDLKGSKLPDFWQNPDDRKQYLSELMSTGVVRNFLINAKTIDGQQIVVMANSHLVRDERGNPVRIEGTYNDFTERKRMEERVDHLNLVLKAIRNVNQLIVREKDCETVIRRSCGILTETRGYVSAWIALYDESGRYLTAASAGLGGAFEPLKNCLAHDQLGACGKALHESGVHLVRDPATQCAGCPAARLYQNMSAIAVRLEHQGRVHGLLVVSMDPALIDVVEEQDLIEEVADDIAYALHGLEVDNRRSAAEREVASHRDELEQRVRDRTAQLEEINKELEAFSYSVSHDLRAPLRAIDGFTRILADDFAPQLDAEGKRLCSIVHENTVKMSRLIDDLLAFSRLGRAEMALSRIDMATLARSVFFELTTAENRARIDFKVGSVPPAVADATLMRQVWMNLLSNAIKFSSKRERAVIEVSATQHAGETAYAVADNGAGFDMKYVQKLFGVFQRLHSSKEFEGTGVGLALVQRIVRRHDGRVWATGETDRGATFYFALSQKGS